MYDNLFVKLFYSSPVFLVAKLIYNFLCWFVRISVRKLKAISAAFDEFCYLEFKHPLRPRRIEIREGLQCLYG